MKLKNMYKRFIKRILDLTVSLIALPIVLIIILVFAPLIRLEDRGSIFYNAPRIGMNGKIFNMYKLRSMKMNAPDIRNSDGSTYNSDDDPRVTKIGRFIRKTSIDELPQFLNVLKGDMSIVGPRPTVPLDGFDYSVLDSVRSERYKVKPGITGYSQAYYRNSITQENKYDLDAYYASNVSLKLDVKIFLKTVISVIKRDNVYGTENEEAEKV